MVPASTKLPDVADVLDAMVRTDDIVQIATQ
jgi:hypothetical protein